MQEWAEKELNEWVEQRETFCLYVYTSMCGTCQVASKMLRVILELVPQLVVGKMNISFAPNLADQYKIESVPCLIIFKDGIVQNKIYAFQSVPYLYSLLNKLMNQ